MAEKIEIEFELKYKDALKDINKLEKDGLNIVFETAQIVFNQVLDAFINIYKTVTESAENFDALGKVVKSIVTLAFTPLKLSFYAIKLGLQVAQLAWEKSFFGDGDPETIKGLNAAIQETKNDIEEVAVAAVDAGSSIVTNIAEAVTEVVAIGESAVEEFGKVSIKVAAETAKSNTALKKSAAIAAAESRMALERYATESEQLRQIRDDDRNSIEDRIKANNDLKEVLAKQQAEMLNNVAMVERAAQAQFDLTGKDEDYIAVLDAKAERLGVISAIEGFNSEQKSNDTALTKEQIDLTKSQLESESLLSIERQRFNAELITDELARLTKMQEIDEIEKEQETLRLQGIIDTANAGTQAKVDAQTALDEFLETARQTNLTRDQEIAEAERALDEQKTASKQKALDDLITIGGAESKFGKAMLIAKQLILARELIMDIQGTSSAAIAAANKTTLKASEAGVDVATGAAKAVSAFAPPFNIPIIIGYAAQAVGIVSAIKGAMSKSKAATGKFGASGGGQAPTVPETPTPSIPPAFNIVGGSETNQLADAIGGQSQQPVQAFVVASEVTTAQSLERNTIAGATIG